MPLGDKINVARKEQNCQKIGSERVKVRISSVCLKVSDFLYYACFCLSRLWSG